MAVCALQVAVVPVDLGVDVQRVSEVAEGTGGAISGYRAFEQATCGSVLAGVQERRCRVREDSPSITGRRGDRSFAFGMWQAPRWMSYPVTFDVERPSEFRRVHVFLRLALLVVIGWIGHPFGLLWLGIPVVAAILVSQKGGQRYLDENGPMVTRVLSWILAVVAYLALLTDRLPGGDEDPVRFEVERSGSPTVGSALLRILYAIPSLIVLALLVFAGAIVWVIAVVLVLVNERNPESLWRFLRGIVRWEACLFVYLASLVDRHPPFRLETGPVSPAAPSS